MTEEERRKFEQWKRSFGSKEALSQAVYRYNADPYWYGGPQEARYIKKGASEEAIEDYYWSVREDEERRERERREFQEAKQALDEYYAREKAKERESAEIESRRVPEKSESGIRSHEVIKGVSKRPERIVEQFHPEYELTEAEEMRRMLEWEKLNAQPIEDKRSTWITSFDRKKMAEAAERKKREEEEKVLERSKLKKVGLKKTLNMAVKIKELDDASAKERKERESIVEKALKAGKKRSEINVQDLRDKEGKARGKKLYKMLKAQQTEK